MRAAIYARLSSDPRGVSRSVGEQEAEAREDCARRGWDVVEVYRDNNRSASKYARRDREEFERLRADLVAGRMDVIVAWEASRFVRDLAVYADLAAACVEHQVLYSYNGKVLDLSDPDDAFNAGLDSLLSEREAGVTRRRILRSHRANAQRGHPHGQIPYGYRRVYDDRTGALLRQVPDEAQAVVVREIFHRLGQGDSLRGIARSLSERGVASPSGRERWSPTGVRKIAEREGYLGKRTWNGQTMPEGGWEPLVDAAAYRKVQAVLQDPRRRQRASDTRVRHLLSGLLTCEVCQGPVTSWVMHGAPAYRCEAYGHVSRTKALIEPALEHLVELRLADPVLTAALAEADPELDRTLEETRRLEGELDELERAVLAGELTARMASAEERRLTAALVALPKPKAPLSQAVLDAAGQGRFRVLDLAQKRAVVRALFSSLVVLQKKTRPEIGRRDPGLLFQWTGSSEQHLLPGLPGR